MVFALTGCLKTGGMRASRRTVAMPRPLQAGDPEELRSVNRRVRERTGSRARGQGHRRFGDGR